MDAWSVDESDKKAADTVGRLPYCKYKLIWTSIYIHLSIPIYTRHCTLRKKK